MGCYGIRGAIGVDDNAAEPILRATRSLLEEMVSRNHLTVEEIVAVIFTATPDLDSVYPARAAREMGWRDTPLLCMQEMAVQGSLERCLRALVLARGDRHPSIVRHVYLGSARVLRPDWLEEGDE